jgi:hypothetical protein
LGDAGGGGVGGADGDGDGGDGDGVAGPGKAGTGERGRGGGGGGDGGSGEGGGGGGSLAGVGGGEMAVCFTLYVTPPASMDSACPSYSRACQALFSESSDSIATAAPASAAEIVIWCTVPTAMRRRPASRRRRLSGTTTTSTWSALEIDGEASAMPCASSAQ